MTFGQALFLHPLPMETLVCSRNWATDFFLLEGETPFY